MVKATHPIENFDDLLSYGNRQLRLYLATVVLFILSSGPLIEYAVAQKRSGPVRIGTLTTSWGPTPATEALRNSLLEMGYRERQDFVIGVRFTQGDNIALVEAAKQLVGYDVDLIYAVGNSLTAKAAQQATSQIPIVFNAVSDPIKFGLIESFSHPGGNITGVSDLGIELLPKRLEVFREMLPGLKRVLFPYDPADPEHLFELLAYRSAAKRLNIRLVEKPLNTEVEAKKTLNLIHTDQVDGILAPRCCSFNLPGLILEIAAQNHLPTMFQQAFWVERGALASYGPDYYASGQQSARLVDKIIKGTKPSDIPVETNSKIEFVINRQTAKALNLTIAPEVLFQANRLIQ